MPGSTVEPRELSPTSGTSILITSAPRSAISMYGTVPACAVEQATTLTPCKGPCGVFIAIISTSGGLVDYRPRAGGGTSRRPILCHRRLFRLEFLHPLEQGDPPMAFRPIQTEMVSYTGHNRDKGEAYYARPTGNGPFPGVVIIHHMPGWDEWTCEVARKFAHHGYAAVAPSLYFRVGDGADEAVVAKVRGDGGNPDDQIVGDVAGAVAFLREQSHASGKGGGL